MLQTLSLQNDQKWQNVNELELKQKQLLDLYRICASFLIEMYLCVPAVDSAASWDSSPWQRDDNDMLSKFRNYEI